MSTMPLSYPDRAEIANYLGRISAITFFSEMEEKLKAIVRDRFTHGGDEKLAHFLLKTNDNNLKRMKRGEISDTVALFGDECKINFQLQFPDHELTLYQNVIQDRHQAAHGVGTDVTLSEVKSAVDIAEQMLTAIGEIIA